MKHILLAFVAVIMLIALAVLPLTITQKWCEATNSHTAKQDDQQRPG